MVAKCLQSKDPLQKEKEELEKLEKRAKKIQEKELMERREREKAEKERKKKKKKNKKSGTTTNDDPYDDFGEDRGIIRWITVMKSVTYSTPSTFVRASYVQMSTRRSKLITVVSIDD